MSSIDRLLLYGIRSFGPEEKERAVIPFSSPVTLILGQNGCGKTTIIEALKYATCGELPSGTDNGSGFVHDPKLSGRIDTYGHVKLQCKNVKGEKTIIARTVLVTQKAKKLEFKTLDSTVTNDKRESISGKHVDIDALTCNLLGVSKAVLTNVIFCHQEDSSWPLEKGKKMKEKFDAIFGVTQYNKCLDHMRTLAKKKDIEKKLLQKDVDYGAERWEETKKKREQMEEIKKKLNASNDMIESFNKEIQPLESKYQELVEKYDNFNEHFAEVGNKKNEKMHLIKSQKVLEESIVNHFFGSKEELKCKIANFQQELENKENKFRRLENDKERLEKDESRLHKQRNVVSLKLGSAQAEEEQIHNKIKTRNINMKELAEDLKLRISSFDAIDESGIKELLQSIENKIEEDFKQSEKQQEGHENIEKQLQHKIDQSREEKVKLTHEIEMKKKNIQDNKNEIQKVNKEIEELDKSAEMLGVLERNLAKVNEELNELVKALDVEQQKNNIENYTKERNELEKKIIELDREIRTLQKYSIEKAHLDQLCNRKNKREEEFKILKEKISSSLQHLLKEVPNFDYKNKLNARLKALEADVASQEKIISQQKNQLTILTEKKRFVDEQLKSKQRKLAADEDNIDECCRNQDFQEFLKGIDDKIENIQDVKGTITSSEFLFKRYLDKLNSDNPLCPLCKRDFNDDEEKQSVIDDLNKRLKEFPTKLKQTKVELEGLKENQSRALQLKPIYDNITVLRNKEIPKLKNEMNELNKKIQEINDDITTRTNNLMEPITDREMANNLLPKVMELDQIQKELSKLEEEILVQEKKLPATGLSKTLQEANNEQDELKSKLNKVRKNLEDTQAKLSFHNEKLSKLREKKNDITTKQMKIEGGAHRRKALTERVEELQMIESILCDELSNAENSFEPVKKTLDDNTQNLRKKKLEHKMLSDQGKKKLNEQKNKFREISSFHDEIEKYELGGSRNKLKELEEELKSLQFDLNKITDEKKKLDKEIESINQLRNTSKVAKVDLENNLKLREKKEEVAKVEEEIKQLEGQTGTITIQSIAAQKAQVQKQIKDLEAQKFIAEGRLTQLQQNLREVERELKNPKYKNAEEDYRKNVISLKVLTLAIDDLKQYERAMDWAMIYFHKERLKMINTIVRNYWRQIYSGNDIDTIEIKTDETQLSTSGRKSYNYGVVQMKNGTEIDMPGRCSAGQKVLACLIIRMALAETFSKNCGILALDEPTTNLDRENIERLSIALAEIVNRRINEKNFQLLIITHDEEFLRRLSNIDKVEEYLLVQRNSHGKSEVKKMKF